MKVEIVHVKFVVLTRTVQDIKTSGRRILDITPCKFKVSGQDKSILTATEYIVVSQ